MADPGAEIRGKWSPGGDRYYSTSPFWKTRWEMSPMFTLASRAGFKVERLVNHSMGEAAGDRPGCIMHARGKKPTIPYLPKSLRRSRPPSASLSPSPSTYTIPALMGSGSKMSIQTRHVDAVLFRKSIAHPGPADYSTQTELGNHRPRYSMGGRTEVLQSSCKRPGPADYNVKTIFDRYNISPTNYVPVFMRTNSE